MIARLLKGAAASVLLAMLEQPTARQTASDLMLETGYSRNAIKAGAALLVRLDLIAVDGEGWALPAATRTAWGARLLENADAKTATRVSIDTPSAAFAAAATSGQYVSSSSSKQQAAKQRRRAKIDSGNGQTTDARPPLDGQPAEIADLLEAAGVGRNSPKMRALLAARLSADFVRSHIAARDAALARGESYGVGLLITRLLDGDAVPAAAACRCGRCDACLARLRATFGDALRW